MLQILPVPNEQRTEMVAEKFSAKLVDFRGARVPYHLGVPELKFIFTNWEGKWPNFTIYHIQPSAEPAHELGP